MHDIKTQIFDYGVRPIWTTSLASAQQWGGLHLLSGMKREELKVDFT